jgi:hypothetical protein
VSKNVALYRAHKSNKATCKKYLLENERYNDCLLVKAILCSDIEAGDIINLVKVNHPRLKLFDFDGFSAPKNFIIVRDKERRFGHRGQTGYVSDCGKPPSIKQKLHDPYSILMSLFIRQDENLIHYFLDKFPEFSIYLPKVLELFLIDADAFEELKLVAKYTINPIAYDFAKKKYKSERYEFLKCDYVLEEGKEYYVDFDDTWWC